MIARIATEGQYRLPDACRQRFDELDDDVGDAVERADDGRFQQRLSALLDFVRGGELLDDDSLEASDVILPPPDVSLEEARIEFTGDGLIPNSTERS